MSDYKYFLYHKLLVLTVNLMVLATIFISMYRASLYPDDFNHTFFKTIFPLLICTLLTGYLGKRLIRRRYTPSAEAVAAADALQASQQASQI